MTTGIIKYGDNAIGTIVNASLTIGTEAVGEQFYATPNGEVRYDLFTISGSAETENGIADLEPSEDVNLLVNWELVEPNAVGMGFIQSYDGKNITIQGHIHYK